MSARCVVLVLFGGRSVEHEVSCESARNIVAALDPTKYEVLLVGIDKEGIWRLCGPEDLALPECPHDRDEVALVPHPQGGKLYSLSEGKVIASPDVVFPVLHGTFGEDGSLQGLLEIVDLPYVGSGVTGSAICMDKEITKRLLREAGLPVARFLVATRDAMPSFDEAVQVLGHPLFVKPATLGSSVGAAKVTNKEEFCMALEEAFRYDHRVLIEEYIAGREIECSVLGNENPSASLPGEIIPRHPFYSYEAKYLDPYGAELLAPAPLDAGTTRRIQELAILAFQVCHCAGMARVDFFLRGEDIYINEVNTIPGFTKISMYPKLWEVSGIPYSLLLDRLIALAFERKERERKLHRSFR
ncbi:D-alanine--D-alanine ligase family protein [Candidatus Caldatribacterium sp.]|uniref:D-alanine--D-alanine ligase family protein n=1 Tax=Candidatus Caldatribacterium sp. TaxID=2282143 RepID=UPI002996A513|nr:D-alanine--D-alanine ligase [Candidatus Caldatribacterium sp.]MDW8081839.1 D-alanine--D-alanine ligase family protein [Candidatus Calescibacterium sp.]